MEYGYPKAIQYFNHNIYLDDKWVRYLISLTCFIFLGSIITADDDCSHEIKRCLLLGKISMKKLDSILKSRDITLPEKWLYIQNFSFSSSHVWMWVSYHKDTWAQKNWCHRTVVLERILESPLDYKDMKSASPKGNQPLIFKVLMLKVQYFGNLMWRANLL